MGEQLSKVYEPKAIESQANEIWFSHLYFHAEPADDGEDEKTYTIVIPPPNVTAPLHLGHALNNTLQDVLIRFHRMQKYNTLWMPGTDHAGIATQTVVEKRILSEENKQRTDFEREEFVARVQAWKDEYEARIISQLQAMGCSCDWQRTRFTMDQTCAKAVRAAFFKLFEDGLIYKTRFTDEGEPVETTLFARSNDMVSADGIVWREKDNRIYVADILHNAAHVVDMNGNVQTLHSNPDTDGADGSLDQPCEVLIRGNELIVVSMDMPWEDPTGLLVNTKIDEPYTLSVIPLQ